MTLSSACESFGLEIEHRVLNKGSTLFQIIAELQITVTRKAEEQGNSRLITLIKEFDLDLTSSSQVHMMGNFEGLDGSNTE